MRKYLILCLISLSILACNKEPEKHKNNSQLLVYATENKACQDFWQKNSEEFTELFDCDIEWKIFSESKDLYAELKHDIDSTEIKVDLVLGLDNLTANQAIIDSVFLQVDLPNFSKLNEKFKIPDGKLVPICYSPMGFIFNTSMQENYPETFGEMQDGIYQKKILMARPDKSAIGNAYLAFSVAAFGRNGYGHFWRSLSDNIFLITDSWDLAIDMFLAELAPMILAPVSYVSYFNQLEADKFASFIPQEGTIYYLEYGAVLAGSEAKKLAENFLNYTISDQFQINILRGRTLLPTNKNITVNIELPKENKIHKLPYTTVQKANQIPGWNKRWERLIQ